jgi:hypothetical protein
MGMSQLCLTRTSVCLIASSRFRNGAVDADVAQADGGPVPALEPIEERLRGRFTLSFELGPNLWPDRVTAERVCDAHRG